MATRPLDIDDLLQQVSRSFFLTLRILPRSIKRPIGIAYLLARASDTIADTALVQIPRRREALLQLRTSVRDACNDRSVAPPDFGDLTEAQEAVTGEGTPAERILIQRTGELLQAFRGLAFSDRLRICKLLDTITQGQETDLMRFGTNEGQLTALSDDEELDRYAYDVAGCVGEFWTEMCRAHVFPSARLDDAGLMANGIRFGKGLQLVNILRDLPRDLRKVRCYIPQNRLSEYGLNPRELLDSAAMERFRPLYNLYLQQAEDHLSAGWQYTLSLPFRCLRIRLACAWPILIGVKTLAKLRRSNVLDDKVRVRISHAEIRWLLLRSAVLCLNPAAWGRMFHTINREEP
jgi:farnesyl-diphosphate farnesyltransferase